MSAIVKHGGHCVQKQRDDGQRALHLRRPTLPFFLATRTCIRYAQKTSVVNFAQRARLSDVQVANISDFNPKAIHRERVHTFS